MSITSERNAEILSSVSSFRGEDGKSRFILVGSLGRGVLLGSQIEELIDPKNQRFQDVDVIDRTGVLRSQYLFEGGKLDTQPTQVVRPIQPESQTWGFFDKHEIPSINPDPLSTFSEASLDLTDTGFSTLHPDRTIPIPSAHAMIFLSNFFAYSQNLPKHHDQLTALRERALEGTKPELGIAYSEYIKEMQRRYPRKGYTRARQIFFNFAPKMTLSLQQGKLGHTVRRVRGTEKPKDLPLNLEDI